MSSETLKKLKLDAVLSPGQSVGGRYRVDRLLAEGGMAEVWAGENLRTGKRVALKVIRRSFAVHSIATEMFRRESIAASKVNHPNVVSVFDVIDHDGLTLIVMELLHGESFAAYLDQHKPLSLNETVMLLLPAMRGVAAAHAQGVVHRDLKPGNIFLCRDNDGSLLTTKVLDFGISKVGGRPTNSESDQVDLAHFGTPAYMSPEDVAGSSAADSRSDVYAFGVLLFESITGQLPFDGQPSIELLQRILNEAPAKLRSLRPDLPAEIEQIVDRALAKKPGERFPDVSSMIQAIEERVLPPLAIPRSLMPMVESSLSYAAGTSTRILIGPPTQPKELSAWQKGLHQARVVCEKALRSRLGRSLPFRVALAVALLVSVSILTWRSLARSSATVSEARAAALSVAAHAAAVAPQPAPEPVPTPAPVPQPAVEPQVTPAPQPAAELPSSPQAEPELSLPAAPAAADERHPGTHSRSETAVRPDVVGDSNWDPFEHNRQPAKPARSKKGGAAGPRAGRLSPSDF